LEFVPWYERADFYNKTVALFSQQMNVLRAIIGVIIVLSISNMLVMNVLERTGEIGTLLAVGFKRKKIMQQFAMEGLLLGLIGGTAAS
jgi:putative ABC transport system permease protein